jgi:hypothetical protein
MSRLSRITSGSVRLRASAVGAFRLPLLWLIFALAASSADQRTVNWSGSYSSCTQRFELLKHGPLDLGVKISTSNPLLAEQFRIAMDFWSGVLEMRWHQETGNSCAMQLVDGTREILKKSIVARSQFTDWENFQGWIAFDPTARLSRAEMYLTAVHEIGHMLGLKHNPNAQSVMYYLDLEGPEFLDTSDLASLASRHKLRIPRRVQISVLRAVALARN